MNHVLLYLSVQYLIFFNTLSPILKIFLNNFLIHIILIILSYCSSSLKCCLALYLLVASTLNVASARIMCEQYDIKSTSNVNSYIDLGGLEWMYIYKLNIIQLYMSSEIELDFMTQTLHSVNSWFLSDILLLVQCNNIH